MATKIYKIPSTGHLETIDFINLEFDATFVLDYAHDISNLLTIYNQDGSVNTNFNIATPSSIIMENVNYSGVWFNNNYGNGDKYSIMVILNVHKKGLGKPKLRFFPILFGKVGVI